MKHMKQHDMCALHVETEDYSPAHFENFFLFVQPLPTNYLHTLTPLLCR